MSKMFILILNLFRYFY